MGQKPGIRFSTERKWGVSSDEPCSLCGKDTLVFWFEGTEAYVNESLCLECLQDAMALIQKENGSK